MVFSSEDTIFIKNLVLLKGYSSSRLIKEFPQKGWNKNCLDVLLGKIRKTNPPDVQPLTDGLRRHLEARVHGIVLRGTWGEGQRRILHECSVDGEDVASDLGDVKRLLHLPVGQCPTAHRAKDTIALLRRETPSFIGPELWPANSPDLNPVDYRIWGLIQERVYQTSIRDIDQLKERLIV